MRRWVQTSWGGLREQGPSVFDQPTAIRVWGRRSQLHLPSLIHVEELLEVVIGPAHMAQPGRGSRLESGFIAPTPSQRWCANDPGDPDPRLRPTPGAEAEGEAPPQASRAGSTGCWVSGNLRSPVIWNRFSFRVICAPSVLTAELFDLQPRAEGLRGPSTPTAGLP